ncbi:MAG TPA: Ig-like domain-containing protein [Mobilitalea sp.]|nr:Ig-like domain-containing protein [Mobilitalea sp.]
MRRLRKIILTALLLAFATTFLDVPVLSNTATVQAATLKISNKKLTLEVGQTKTLRVTGGTTKKVTWTSNKKEVATVTSKGKVTAVAAGEAKITAKVGDKKLYCTVTVTAPANPYIANAPFAVEETQVDSLDFVIPAGWKVNTQDLADGYLYTEITPDDSNLMSAIKLNIMTNDTEPTDYDALKEAFSSEYSQDAITKIWQDSLGATAFEMTNFTQGDYEAPYNKVFKTQYTITVDGTAAVTQSIYIFTIGKYVVVFSAEDYDQMDLATITDYMIDSFMTK